MCPETLGRPLPPRPKATDSRLLLDYLEESPEEDRSEWLAVGFPLPPFWRPYRSTRTVHPTSRRSANNDAGSVGSESKIDVNAPVEAARESETADRESVSAVELEGLACERDSVRDATVNMKKLSTDSSPKEGATPTPSGAYEHASGGEGDSHSRDR